MRKIVWTTAGKKYTLCLNALFFFVRLTNRQMLKTKESQTFIWLCVISHLLDQKSFSDRILFASYFLLFVIFVTIDYVVDMNDLCVIM